MRGQPNVDRHRLALDGYSPNASKTEPGNLGDA